jgi:site-specific DNA-methyltransferase (adenine-specific)
MGDETLMSLRNGDCLQLIRDIPSESVDAIITDPPYGILKHRIETGVDIALFFDECARVLKPNSFIVFFGQQPTLTTWNASAYARFNYKAEIIWYKRNRSSPVNDIGRVHENITICVKGKRNLNRTYLPFIDVKNAMAEFVDVNTIKRPITQLLSFFKNKSSFEDAQQYLSALDMREFYVQERKVNEYVTVRSKLFTKEHKYSDLDMLSNGQLPQSVVSFIPHNKQGYNDLDHNVAFPSVKPTQLMEYLVELTTESDALVLDPFMGSGTTGIACVNLKRGFIGIELDSQYYELAVARVEESKKNKQGELL